MATDSGTTVLVSQANHKHYSQALSLIPSPQRTRLLAVCRPWRRVHFGPRTSSETPAARGHLLLPGGPALPLTQQASRARCPNHSVLLCSLRTVGLCPARSPSASIRSTYSVG
uniref:Uncharacterized protein n=1 Tax=Steinernema glaseri TaxID=37863 RepID=A0A1I7Y0D0_9BILA